MATVTVSADNNRRAVATIATDGGTWGNDGGGGGVSDEPDIVYQGSTAQSRKVSTSRIGRQYDDNATTDLTAADRRHVIFKINITNYAALLSRTSPAAGLKIGSASTAYYEYYVFGNDNYPVLGGWQILAISPNVSGYRNATTGSPSLTAADYYSFLADFSATSKSENLIIDAIDVGRGLKLTGGDGADPDGDFDDFITTDEGTSGNRWGYVTTRSGIMYVVGELAIGENTSETAVATVFQDTTGQVLVWENGYVESGFHRFRVNLGSATTDVDITGATFDSVGKDNNDADRGYTTTEDSRLDVTVTGTSGDCKFIQCTFKNLGSMDLTSATTLDTCDAQMEDMTMSGAEIFDSVIRTTSAANVATLTDPTFGTSTDLRDTEFIQEGSGHAIELDTAGTYDFPNLTWTGYGADTSSSAAVFISATTGAVTINYTGGNTPTYRRPTGPAPTIQTSVTVTVNVKDADGNAIQSAAVRVQTDPGGTLISQGNTNASGVYSFTYTSTIPQNVLIKVRLKGWEPATTTGTIAASVGLTSNFTLNPDVVVNLP